MSGRGRPLTEPGTYGKVSEPRILANGDLQVSATLRLLSGRTRRITGSGRTKTLATSALEQAKVEILGAPGASKLSTKTRVSTLGTLWLDEIRKSGLAIQSIQRYEASVKGAIERDLGALTIRELTNDDIRQFVRDIADRGQIAEARSCRVVVRAVLGYAINRGVGSAALISFDGFKLPVPLKKPRAITLDELERLRALVAADMVRPRSGRKSRRAHEDLLDVIDLILATSVRISEVLAITRDRVDFVAGTVTIDRKVEYVKGSGFRLSDVKTESTERIIPLPNFALEILSERFADGRYTAFVTKSGGLLSQNNVRRTLRGITAGTEFEDWLTPHTGRKTVATVVNNEFGSVIASQVLGHDGDRLIITTYGEKKKLAPNVTGITEQFGRSQRAGI